MNRLDVKLSLGSVLDWTYLKFQVLCKKKFFGVFFNKVIRSQFIFTYMYYSLLMFQLNSFQNSDIWIWQINTGECSPADGGEFMQRSRQCHDHLIRLWWKQKSLSDTLQNNRNFTRSWRFPHFPKETWHFLDLL